MSPHSINTSPKIKDRWIIQTWFHPADGLSLSLDRNFLNLCVLGWNSHVGIICAIRAVCAASVSVRTLGAVNVGDFDIWDAKYYSNDEWINFHAERQETDRAASFQSRSSSVIVWGAWSTTTWTDVAFTWEFVQCMFSVVYFHCLQRPVLTSALIPHCHIPSIQQPHNHPMRQSCHPQSREVRIWKSNSNCHLWSGATAVRPGLPRQNRKSH